MKPPYKITPYILAKVASISEKLGEIKAARLHRPPTELRKRNRIRTIHSSLVIEGNMLTFDQVTALLEKKRVIAPLKDITEVKNAIRVYENIGLFDPFSIESLCEAHRILMDGLVENAGRLRNKSVGIMKGKQLAHVAPSGTLVKSLLNDLMVIWRMMMKYCLSRVVFSIMSLNLSIRFLMETEEWDVCGKVLF